MVKDTLLATGFVCLIGSGFHMCMKEHILVALNH